MISATWNGSSLNGTSTRTVNYGAGPFTLTATANTGDNVTWPGNCDSTLGNGTGAGTCTINAGISASKNVTATFTSTDCATKDVKNANTSVYYNTVQSGYSAAQSTHAILMRAIAFLEDLLLNNTNAVVLKGGYDCDYNSNNGSYTTINGKLTISGGTGRVTVEKLIVK